MATNAAAQIVYSGEQNLTASIRSLGNPRKGVSSTAVGTGQERQALLMGAAGFDIGVGQGCCSSNFLGGNAFVTGVGGLRFLQTGKSGSFLRRFGGGINISTATGNFKAVTAFVHTFAKSVNGFITSSGSWKPHQTSFAAFRFKTGASADATTDYGWVRLVYTVSANNAPDRITAVDWAYGANGTEIVTGEIPEPSTAGLAILAAGAAGVAALRRRRKSRPEADA